MLVPLLNKTQFIAVTTLSASAKPHSGLHVFFAVKQILNLKLTCCKVCRHHTHKLFLSPVGHLLCVLKPLQELALGYKQKANNDWGSNGHVLFFLTISSVQEALNDFKSWIRIFFSIQQPPQWHQMLIDRRVLHVHITTNASWLSFVSGWCPLSFHRSHLPSYTPRPRCSPYACC